MPNLRQSIIEEFWHKKDPRMARILGWMESMEDWMLDDNEEVADSIFALANTLERVSKKEIMNNSEEIIKLMAYMSSPRALRLVEWFDEHFPQGLSLDITKKAVEMEDEETAQLFLDRLNVLHRLSLLTKIFSPHRTRMIVELLSEYPSQP